MKITDIDKEIKKKIVSDRQKDYGDYQYNFTILADLFTLILADNLKKKYFCHDGKDGSCFDKYCVVKMKQQQENNYVW